MAKHSIRSTSTGGGMRKALEAIGKRIAGRLETGGGPVVSVGFFENATYPDGTPVAAVAFWNEYGKRGVQPPRPFFRQMIAKESVTWGPKISKLMKATGYDGPRVLDLMGEDIKGALQQSINDLTSPKLADSTIAAKGFAKPLIATSHMLNSVGYEVKS